MAKEFVNNPCDPAEERFSRLEQQVIDINHIVKLLMEALRNNIGIFGEDGGSNAEDKSEGGSRDREETENQPKKEPIEVNPVQVP